MNDQVAVRIGDSVAHLNEKPESLPEGGVRQHTKVGDGTSFDVFHYHERSAVAGHAAVIQARYARVLQPSQYLALGFEALQLRCGITLQQLDCDPLLEVALRTDSFVHVTHAAASDESRNGPGAQAGTDGSVRHDVIDRGPCRCTEKTDRRLSGEHQAPDLRQHDRIIIL